MRPFKNLPSGISHGCSQTFRVIVEMAPPSPISNRVEMPLSALRAGRSLCQFLTVAERCLTCDLDLSAHDSGDGPAVFVIFILGALVVPLAFWLEVTMAPPTWVHLIVWPPVIIVLAILMLWLMKVVLVGYHFQNLRHEYDE